MSPPPAGTASTGPRSAARANLGATAMPSASASHHNAAAASVMIWPIDPVIESGDRAAALWL
ncbi:molecular chaperone, partial [Burkholderia pseudomallei]